MHVNILLKLLQLFEKIMFIFKRFTLYTIHLTQYYCSFTQY